MYDVKIVNTGLLALSTAKADGNVIGFSGIID